MGIHHQRVNTKSMFEKKKRTMFNGYVKLPHGTVFLEDTPVQPWWMQWFHHDSLSQRTGQEGMGVFTRPGKLTVCELENGPVEIVDLPIKNCDFP